MKYINVNDVCEYGNCVHNFIIEYKEEMIKEGIKEMLFVEATYSGPGGYALYIDSYSKNKLAVSVQSERLDSLIPRKEKFLKQLQDEVNEMKKYV